MRRRNLIPDDALSVRGPLRHQVREAFAPRRPRQARCDDGLREAARRAERHSARRGIYRGIGFASFIEVTNPSAAFYGVGGAKISAQDGATVRLDAQGAIICHTGVTEQGQGAEAVIAQVRRPPSFGVPIERVRVIIGDTDNTPYGGGTWASRAAGIGGEAAWQAGKALARRTCSRSPASFCRPSPKALDIRNGIVVDADTGARAHRPRRGRAHRLFPPRHAAARLPGRAGRDAPLRAARLAVRLHQRHPGFAISKSMSTPASSSCSNTGAWRIAAP